MWDVGGQNSLHIDWKNYFESCDGLIWVVDSANIRRLEDCKQEIHKLLQEECLGSSYAFKFGNKQDLPGAVTTEDIVQILDLESIKTHHCKIYKTSAITAENLLQGINWIVEDISKRVFYND